VPGKIMTVGQKMSYTVMGTHIALIMLRLGYNLV